MNHSSTRRTPGSWQWYSYHQKESDRPLIPSPRSKLDYNTVQLQKMRRYDRVQSKRYAREDSAYYKPELISNRIELSLCKMKIGELSSDTFSHTPPTLAFPESLQAIT